MMLLLHWERENMEKIILKAQDIKETKALKAYNNGYSCCDRFYESFDFKA